jgi:hypothetical protein
LLRRTGKSRDIDQKSEEAKVAEDAAFEKKFEEFKKSRAAEEKATLVS